MVFFLLINLSIILVKKEEDINDSATGCEAQLFMILISSFCNINDLATGCEAQLYDIN